MNDWSDSFTSIDEVVSVRNSSHRRIMKSTCWSVWRGMSKMKWMIEKSWLRLSNILLEENYSSLAFVVVVVIYCSALLLNPWHLTWQFQFQPKVPLHCQHPAMAVVVRGPLCFPVWWRGVKEGMRVSSFK